MCTHPHIHTERGSRCDTGITAKARNTYVLTQLLLTISPLAHTITVQVKYTCTTKVPHPQKCVGQNQLKVPTLLFQTRNVVQKWHTYAYSIYVRTCRGTGIDCEHYVAVSLNNKTPCNQLLIDTATYVMLTINSPALKNVAMSLYDIMQR